MPIDTARFWEQVRLGEDSDLELKEVGFLGQRISAPHRDSLADELAAFANSAAVVSSWVSRMIVSRNHWTRSNWMLW